MIQTREPTAEGVAFAARKIAEILRPTPLLPLEIDGQTIWCKAECLQPIGAFKIRGGWHRLTALSGEERERGVVGVSSGNHAQGVAWAARKLGIAATIVMPVDAPAVKLANTRALGAEVALYDRPGGEDRDEVAERVCAGRGATLVHAYADPWVIEGQGSAGIEIAAQMNGQPDLIVTPCGGGGLTAGLALSCPDAAIVPVEPEGWDDVCRSLASGTIQKVTADAPPTACDALQTPATRPINFAILRERCPFGLVASPAEVRAAQRLAFEKLRLVVEPGGAAALAAVLAGKVELAPRTAVMLTGGNTDAAAFAAVLTGSN
ncbi:threonine ammonia-lyase [Novosphingobium album (ex Hu et al. 2023)]|uniref:Pyridoxal-phosphate dependent enzyme n=1 Tax=Novosphingobium album (ex Hu et al. 2023) TaxID=2930093 RepID=A0ABT0AZ93_9SPHN|nr:pyridoxal-phosphate dependent enzyme [Novosphingobium album (ex Hu et al. 2023)]MCJ2178003.1 pyridoxal-phosphate dependent enzyme [Novosphingobium album (ex Hu et al. 2023)]